MLRTIVRNSRPPWRRLEIPNRRRTKAVAACAAATLLALQMAMPGAGLATDEADAKAPSFALQSLDGATFESDKQLAGKPAVIAFWRLDQEYSVEVLKQLVKIRSDFSSSDVKIVTIISGAADRGAVAELATKLGLEFAVLFDPDREAYGAFGVRVAPTCWFIDAKGVKQFDYPGYRRDYSTTARANIDFLLGNISAKEREARATPSKAPKAAQPVATTARYKAARRLLASGRRDAGIAQLENAWESEPPSAPAGLDLGLILLEDGDNEGALAILDKVAKLIPEDPRAIGARGLALLRTGEEDEGAKLLAQAIAADVIEPVFFYDLAVVNERRGNAEEACTYYRRGFEILMEERRPEDQPEEEPE